MIVITNCQHENRKKHGRDHKGQQRYRCLDCGKTFIDKESRPLGELRLPMDKAVLCLRMLLEDSSIRAIERIVGVNRNTILSLIELVGERCQLFWLKRMRNLVVQDVQVDEIWGFVGCKDKTRERLSKSDDTGDAWTFMAIEPRTGPLLAGRNNRHPQAMDAGQPGHGKGLHVARRAAKPEYPNARSQNDPADKRLFQKVGEPRRDIVDLLRLV